MTNRGLDPGGPVLAALFGSKSSDVVVDVVTGAGLRLDWSLDQRQNYSHSTRIREYRVRVAAALDKLGDAQRLRVLVGILRGVLTRGISNVDALNVALEPTGWTFIADDLVGPAQTSPVDQPKNGEVATQIRQ